MYKNKINQIKTLLSMSVKLAQMKLDDGITVVEAEEFAPDYSIGIVTPDGVVPMPVGDYTLEDGRVLSVAQEGIIASIADAAPADAPMSADPSVEVEVEAEAKPKRVVESVSKETFFAEIEKLRAEFSAVKEENEALKADNENLKAEIAKVELERQEQEAGAAPINHNPEAEKSDFFKISAGRADTTMDRVFNKLFN